MLLPESYIPLDDVSSNASIRPFIAGSPSIFPYLVLCYKPTSQNSPSIFYVMVVQAFLCGALPVSLFRDILRSQCCVNSTVKSHKLENPV